MRAEPEDLGLEFGDPRREPGIVDPVVDFLRVAFEVEEGDRGLKASTVRLADSGERKPAESQPVRAAGPGDEGEQLCDVLSQAEYTREITELLLNAAPTLTAEQILLIRRQIVAFGNSHGWIEG